jgi:hypothetical protein
VVHAFLTPINASYDTDDAAMGYIPNVGEHEEIGAACV